jgi:hypothetical protein
MSELKPCPVTQIQAYRAYEKLLEIMEDETDDQTEVFSTAYKALYWIVNGRRAQPANEPLTLDELKQMDGEPVYIVTLENQLENPPYWAIVGISESDSRYQDGIVLYNKTQGDWGGVELYGKTWLAYRHKPKEEHREAD